jgi:arylsulfatase A-like enzyme
MVEAIRDRHLEDSTAIILSAKHGQSPQTPSALTRIPDGPIVTALDAAWQAAHPSATAPLVAFTVDDDGMLMWLNDRSPAATEFAKQFLLSHSGVGNDINLNPKAYTQSGLAQVFTGGHGKIAEHGGANPQDRNVPLVVSGGPVGRHNEVENGRVETTQIAPTILQLLGLDPDVLQAVQIEHTRALELG